MLLVLVEEIPPTTSQTRINMYDFPEIRTINDVLPAIQGHEEFIVIDKERYKIIDYVMQCSHTFPSPTVHYKGSERDTKAMLRECRGIAFYPDGKLLSRPFHKFFNYGEHPEEDKYLITPSHVLQKLDGSMIRPFVFEDHIRLATRKGITDVAMQAEIFMADKPNYFDFIFHQVAEGRTPIFEWCSRNNQIVVEYEKDDLVLLALRDNLTGHYYGHDFVRSLGKSHNITVVGEFIIPEIGHIHVNDYVNYAKTLQDSEGCVIVFPNGHKLKAKGEWYVTLHRAKDIIGREKDLIKLFLAGNIDDLLPLFPEKDQVQITKFMQLVTDNLLVQANKLDKIYRGIVTSMPPEYTRKDFALKVLQQEPRYKAFLFSMLAGDLAVELLAAALIHACRTKKTLDEYRWIIGGIKFKEAKPDAE